MRGQLPAESMGGGSHQHDEMPWGGKKRLGGTAEWEVLLGGGHTLGGVNTPPASSSQQMSPPLTHTPHQTHTPTPLPHWASVESAPSWRALSTLPGLTARCGFSSAAWERWAHSERPEDDWPPSLKASSFEKALLIQAFRPERLYAALGAFVAAELGVDSLEPSHSLESVAGKATKEPSHGSVTVVRPVLLVTAPGAADPTLEIRQMARRRLGGAGGAHTRIVPPPANTAANATDPPNELVVTDPPHKLVEAEHSLAPPSTGRYVELAMGGTASCTSALTSLRSAAADGDWLCLRNVSLTRKNSTHFPPIQIQEQNCTHFPPIRHAPISRDLPDHCVDRCTSFPIGSPSSRLL